MALDGCRLRQSTDPDLGLDVEPDGARGRVRAPTSAADAGVASVVDSTKKRPPLRRSGRLAGEV